MQAPVKVRKKGIVVIPIEIREVMCIEDGDIIIIDVLQKVKSAASEAEAEASTPSAG